MSSSHIVPKSTYYLIFLVLMACTGLTVWVAFIDLGVFNSVAALAIAVFKASLVVLYFMHVKYSPRMTKLVVIASLFWLSILLVMTMGDYATRGWSWGTYGWNIEAAGVDLVRYVSSLPLLGA